MNKENLYPNKHRKYKIFNLNTKFAFKNKFSCMRTSEVSVHTDMTLYFSYKIKFANTKNILKSLKKINKP